MYVADLVYIPENKKIITIDEETGDVVIVEDPAVKAPIIEVNTDIDGYTYPVVTFYTGKAGSGIQVIKSDKTFADAATTQVTTAGGTATWYAHYTANTYNVTYYTAISSFPD